MARAQRRVNAQAGAALGGAVAFEYARAEFAMPNLAGGFLDFRRATKSIAQAVEVIRIGLARVAGEKAVRAEKNGAVEIVKRRRHNPIVQRRGVEANKRAAHQREQQTRRQAE